MVWLALYLMVNLLLTAAYLWARWYRLGRWDVLVVTLIIPFGVPMAILGMVVFTLAISVCAFSGEEL